MRKPGVNPKAVELVAQGIFLQITGSLLMDGSECDEAVWQDAERDARAIIEKMWAGQQEGDRCEMS